LIAKGFKLESKGDCWLVTEPSGAKEDFTTLISLEFYVEMRD
jgi:hypothetical protein